MVPYPRLYVYCRSFRRDCSGDTAISISF